MTLVLFKHISVGKHPANFGGMAIVGRGSVQIPGGARFYSTTELSIMNIRAMVGSHEVQNVLKRGLSSMEDDLAVVNDPNARKRDKKESLKRISQCVDTLNIALTKQDSNFATIKGADSANYVAKRLATADKRKFRARKRMERSLVHLKRLKSGVPGQLKRIRVKW